MSDEGGHWYLADGTPCHQVRGRDGKMRAFNLRWDRSLKAKPSVTTVTKIIAKEALENWKVEQGILSALTLPILAGESEQEYLDRIKEDSKQQAKKAAEEGSRIHNAIDCHYKGRPYDTKYVPHVNAVVAEINRLFPGVTDWVAEKSFAHPLGYGGSCDLHSPSIRVCIDHKGKDGDFTELDKYGKPKKLAWDQNIQLAAYQVGLGLLYTNISPRPAKFTQCANIFVSRTHPGKVASHVWSAEDIAHGWSVFEATLELWKRIKKYDASF